MPLDRAIANLKALPGYQMKSDAEFRRVVLAVLEGVRPAMPEPVRRGAFLVVEEDESEVVFRYRIDHLIREASTD